MNNVVKKSNELNEFGVVIPDVEIGDIVPLSVIWDGNGDAPEKYYSYLLTNNGEDGESNIDVSISYDFEIVEEKEDTLDTLVKVTGIDLI